MITSIRTLWDLVSSHCCDKYPFSTLFEDGSLSGEVLYISYFDLCVVVEGSSPKTPVNIPCFSSVLGEVVNIKSNTPILLLN